MAKKKKAVSKDCPRSESKYHLFQIVPGKGKKTGTPLWKCAYCPAKVRAT